MTSMLIKLCHGYLINIFEIIFVLLLYYPKYSHTISNKAQNRRGNDKQVTTNTCPPSLKQEKIVKKIVRRL